jgi:hypothetical protein
MIDVAAADARQLISAEALAGVLRQGITELFTVTAVSAARLLDCDGRDASWRPANRAMRPSR